MPRGQRREKTIRINEELERINRSLDRANDTIKDLQNRKKELLRELELCQKDSVVQIVEESGLSMDELRSAINMFRESESRVAATA